MYNLSSVLPRCTIVTTPPQPDTCKRRRQARIPAISPILRNFAPPSKVPTLDDGEKSNSPSPYDRFLTQETTTTRRFVLPPPLPSRLLAGLTQRLMKPPAQPFNRPLTIKGDRRVNCRLLRPDTSGNSPSAMDSSLHYHSLIDSGTTDVGGSSNNFPPTLLARLFRLIPQETHCSLGPAAGCSETRPKRYTAREATP